MEKYDDFAFASKENLENLSKAYNNSLKVDALNTGESNSGGSTSPNRNTGTTPNPQNGATPISPNLGDNNTTTPATPVKTTPTKKSNSLAQFNFLLFAIMLSLINDNSGGCGCSNRR